MEYSPQQKINPQNSYTKKNSFTRKLKIVAITLFVFFIVSDVLRPVLVVDRSTFMPISGAHVVYKDYGWNGCLDDYNGYTNLGIIFAFFKFSPCQIDVSKGGYHINGANDILSLSGLFGFRIVALNRTNNPQKFVKFDRMFTSENPSMDVASFLSTPSMMGRYSDNNDFKFTVIDNEAKESNTIGRPILNIEFYGDGGVQQISSDYIRGNSVSNYYDLENLLSAPIDGYEKTLALDNYRSYVARLKDGIHYIKFYVFSSKDSHGKSYACMTGFIQPLPSVNLEFNDIYKSRICDEDSMYDYVVR